MAHQASTTFATKSWPSRPLGQVRAPRVYRPRPARAGATPAQAVALCAFLRANGIAQHFPQLYANKASCKVVGIDDYERYCQGHGKFVLRGGEMATNEKACLRMQHVAGEYARLGTAAASKCVTRLVAEAKRAFP